MEQDEDEGDDDDEDDRKEPWTFGLGEMVNTSADDVHTMVDDMPIVLLEQGEEMPKHTPQPHIPAPAPQPLTMVPRP